MKACVSGSFAVATHHYAAQCLDRKNIGPDNAVQDILEQKLIDKWSGSYPNNFTCNFSLNNFSQYSDVYYHNFTGSIESFIKDLYKFLDSLNLIEEAAFIHILIFIYILLCIYTIIAVFFGNELIRYFNLEEKYPKLSTFFRLRATFQRYYLAINIFSIIFMCVVGIVMNVLVLFF